MKRRRTDNIRRQCSLSAIRFNDGTLGVLIGFRRGTGGWGFFFFRGRDEFSNTENAGEKGKRKFQISSNVDFNPNRFRRLRQFKRRRTDVYTARHVFIIFSVFYYAQLVCAYTRRRSCVTIFVKSRPSTVHALLK